MVTQAEKGAIAREFWPQDVQQALEYYRWSRALFLSIRRKGLRRDFMMLAIYARRAYWSARKAAGL